MDFFLYTVIIISGVLLLRSRFRGNEKTIHGKLVEAQTRLEELKTRRTEINQEISKARRQKKKIKVDLTKELAEIVNEEAEIRRDNNLHEEQW